MLKSNLWEYSDAYMLVSIIIDGAGADDAAND